MSSVTSPEEICNLALDLVGYPESIGDLFEGTRQARVALRFYAQTRDELLRSKDWGFARQACVLALTKQAPFNGYGTTPWNPTNPPLPWVYEYAYPPACVEVRSVRPTPVMIPEYDPKPWVFVVGNDPNASAGKVILTNLAAATAVITGQVTNMTLWEPMFVEALVEALARRFAVPLNGDGAVLKAGMIEEQATASAAAARLG